MTYQSYYPSWLLCPGAAGHPSCPRGSRYREWLPGVQGWPGMVTMSGKLPPTIACSHPAGDTQKDWEVHLPVATAAVPGWSLAPCAAASYRMLLEWGRSNLGFPPFLGQLRIVAAMSRFPPTSCPQRYH